jgi:predicted PurR-regulated permease PerM
VLALSQATNALTNAGKLMFQFSLVILFSFFLFRDGEKLMEQIKAVIPMTPDKADLTINHLRAIVESTMYGGVVVALTQGLLGGLLFLIMGLPSPVFWGAVMTFLAFLPILGPFLIYIPAGIILILNGAYVKGVIILIIGTVVVSQVDNFLRPMLVSGKTGMHTMLMFISMIGGASLFGLLGVVLGPFIAAIFVSIFDIFRLKLIENGAPPPEPATSPPTPRLGPDDEEPIDL